MNVVRLFASLGIIVGAIIAQASARATPLCAATPGELYDRFLKAKNDLEGTTQEIRVVRGTYSLSGALEFQPAGDKDNKKFSLTGGWSAGCPNGSQILKPDNTVIKFTGATFDSRKVNFYGDNASYRVEGVRFEGFSRLTIDDKDCTFDICPDTDSITVRYNEFRSGGEVRVVAQDARVVTIKNNLFDNGASVSLQYTNDETNPDISFNTFANTHCSSSDRSAFEYYSEKSGGVLHHNIFAQSVGCKADFDIEESTGAASFYHGFPVTLYNNLYTKPTGLTPTVGPGNLTGDPGFADPANYNFKLRTTFPPSQAIDAGMTPAELITNGLSLPGQSLDGGPRFVGTRFDMGAYEAPGVAPDDITVINTNDKGEGSLRAAIIAANGKAGTQTIKFAISGSCPLKIGLVTALDDIVDDLVIDGYSQPGSAKNSYPISSNANLCIKVGPASGTLSRALRVPDTAPPTTQLTLSGIAFTGGHSIAVELSGGSGHYVWGNAFGGVRPGGTDPLGDTNLSHLAVRNEALGVSIGGGEPRERNYFGTSQLNAILLLDGTSGGHTVQNNYIGLDPGGAFPQPLGANAISAQDSPNIRIEGNVITGADAGIRISGASAKGYVIQGNTFGLDAFGGTQASGANEEGILITNGSGGHTIGSASGTARSNIITNSKRAGVWIDSTAGVGTIVRPNSIYNNGTYGVGLGIDLGALGPLANDDKDPDGSGNAGQNAPVLTGSVPGLSGSRQIIGRLNSNVGSTFRIDVYRSPACIGGARGGDAKTRLGGTIVTTAADTGIATFSFAGSGTGAPAFITAIATNTAIGSTSEIGACFNEDTIFKNGAEGGGF